MRDSLDRIRSSWSSFDLPTRIAAQGYRLRALFGALLSVALRLRARPDSEGISSQEMAQLRGAERVDGNRATELRRKALIEIIRLFDSPLDERDLQDAARLALHAIDGQGNDAFVSVAAKPDLSPRVERQRRCNALETLLRLHLAEPGALSPAFVESCALRLGGLGGEENLEALERLSAVLPEAGAQAQANIRRALHSKIYMISPEAGLTPGDGVKRVVEDGRRLADAGHNVTVFAALPGAGPWEDRGPKLRAAGFHPIEGSWDLLREEGAGPRPFLLWVKTEQGKKGGTFTTVHVPVSGAGFEDASPYDSGNMPRMVTINGLLLSAMRKYAAASRIPDGTRESSRITEIADAQVNLKPSDGPDHIIYHDSYGAGVAMMARQDPLFEQAAVSYWVHNLDPAYCQHHSRERYRQYIPDKLWRVDSGQGDLNGALVMHVLADSVVHVGREYRNRQLYGVADPDQFPMVIREGRRAWLEGRNRVVRNKPDLRAYDPRHAVEGMDVVYDEATVHDGKRRAKAAFQAELIKTARQETDAGRTHFVSDGFTPDADGPLAAFGGRQATQKGIYDLVTPVDKDDPFSSALDRAMMSNPKLRVVIGGPVAEEPVWDAVKAFYDRWAARGRAVAVIRGRVDNRKLMRAADIFLVSSRFEPCGQVQAEAMMTGALLCATRVDGNVEQVSPIDKMKRTGEGALYDPKDPAAAYAALQSLLDIYGTPLWTTLQRNAMQRAAADNDPAEWEQDVEAVLRRAAQLHFTGWQFRAG